MGAVTGASRLFRLDRATWERLAVTTGLGSAVLVALGAYAVLAFDRFGMQGLFAPRAAVRMVLIGFYGWLWLAVAAWLIARLFFDSTTKFPLIFRLYGPAHLPLLVVALTIQVFSVAFRNFGPALVVTVIAVLIWMPALLVAATRQAFDLDMRRSVVTVAIPYAVWLLVVGRTLWSQLGHLL